MGGQQEYALASTSGAAGLEEQLATTLLKTTDEVAHTEFLDVEQRAEIYTILQAMKSDTEVHRNIVGRWVSHKTGEVSDA